ncbi:MAG TPA: biotin/lipoyl-containing protein, partial [Gemmatimonadaceae bacterium]|nr:biotin/lipoyl-containing protein [Gemmatimonadaceae bacterium]
MARIDVVMPQMGESIAEGTLSRWLKKVGDEVKRDEPIFEISTDKVDAEIPASSAGVLAEILVQEGETVPVQTVVARLETEKGAMVEAAAPAAAPKGESAAPAAASATAAASAAPPSGMTPPAAAAPAARAEGVNGASFEARVRTRSSPLVRKIAADHGIDISSMTGSGVAGRVTKRDIIQAIEAGTAPVQGAPAARPGVAAPVAPAAPAMEHRLPPPEAYPGDVVEPMSVMRQRIMEHMVLSRRTSAHVTSFMEIDFTRVARIRAKHREEFLERSGQKLTYMPFIIKAVVDGLKAYPVMNSSVSGT